MRGSPFSFSNLSRGINALDSPYTLTEGECRESLNVVSSPRGAVKKRYGSSAFAAPGVSSFPIVGEIDKLNRAEDPLSSGAKWTKNGLSSVQDIGADTTTGWHQKALAFPTLAVSDSFSRETGPIGAGWVTGKGAAFSELPLEIREERARTGAGVTRSGIWNEALLSSGAATSVEMWTTTAGEQVTLGVNVLQSSPSVLEGYFFQADRVSAEIFKPLLYAYVGETFYSLSSPANFTLKFGDKMGIMAKGGVVSIWRYNKETTTWELLSSVNDSRLTIGHGSLSLKAPESHDVQVDNFSFGAVPASSAYWNVVKQANPIVQAEVAVVPTTVTDKFGLTILSEPATGKGYYGYIYPHASTIEVRLWTESAELAIAVVSRKMEAGEYWGMSLRGGVLSLWYKPVAGVWTKAMETLTATYTEGYLGIYSDIAGSDAFRLRNFAFGEASAPAMAEGVPGSLAKVIISGEPYLLVQIKKKWYSVNSTGLATDITDAGAMTEGTRWSVIQSTSATVDATPNRKAGGPVYMSNGIDPPRYWTGVTMAEWTGKPEGTTFHQVPKAKYLTYLGNRVWASGIAGDTSALRFSGFSEVSVGAEQADPTSWPESQVIFFEKEDGDAITGTGIAGPYLMVFKKHKTWAVFDLNEGENRRVSDNVGCVSHRTIVETSVGTFFLTPDMGVYSTNGTSVKEMSRNVRPILQGIDPFSYRSAKLDQLENASAGWANGHYYLSYIAKDGTQKTLDYDTQLQSWWLHDLAGNQWVLWEPTTGAASLYTIPNRVKTGVVKAFDPTVPWTDSGANYVGTRGQTAFWLSPWEPFWQYFMRHRFNQPNPKKRIRELFVDGKGEVETTAYTTFNPTGVVLKGDVDNQDMATQSSPVVLGTSEREYQAVRYWSLGVSRVWSFGFGNNSSASFEIDSYSVHLNFRKS